MKERHSINKIFVSVLQPVGFIPVPGGVHRHERPASSFPLQHFLLFPRQLQGNLSMFCHRPGPFVCFTRDGAICHVSRVTRVLLQEELARTRELPVPPQPRRSGVLARSDDNLAGDACQTLVLFM